MADDSINPIKDGAGQPDAEGGAEEVSFSDAQQEKINEIISKRLAERDAKHSKELDDLNRKHKRDLEMSKLDEESRLKAEQEEATKALLKRAEDAEHKLSVARTSEALAKVGLPTELAETLMGADADATQANIDRVVKAAKGMADQMYAQRVGSSGAPRAPGGESVPGEMAELRSIMGLK